MKKYVILSLVVIGLWLTASEVFRLCYSPIAGAAVAKTVNGGTTEFATAKFVQEGGVQRLMNLGVAFVLVGIWFGPTYRWVSTGSPAKS